MSRSSQAVEFTDQDRALYEEIVRRIVALADPDKIIIFGSRARGDHRPDSDIDILVIKESTEPRYRRPGPLYGALATLPRAVDIDISVYTPEEVADWRDVRQAFVTTAAREGIVLYERPS